MRARLILGVVAALWAAWLPAAAQQQPTQKPTGGQKPANETPAGPAAAPLYISPVTVQYVQQQLAAKGFPVPTISGAWGEHTSAAVAAYQRAHGLDPGGDLDELTLTALGIGNVLHGDEPAGAKPVASPAAVGDGAPFTASPRLSRIVQNRLTEAGHPTDNVFGIWLAGSETAARAYQKTKGLEPTGALDLRLVHTLGLSDPLMTPELTARSPYDGVASILSERAWPHAGAPLSVSPLGIKQIQDALKQRGQRDVGEDGLWGDDTTAAMKKFQEGQGLEPTGTINLRTLRALGFTLATIDR